MGAGAGSAAAPEGKGFNDDTTVRLGSGDKMALATTASVSLSETCVVKVVCSGAETATVWRPGFKGIGFPSTAGGMECPSTVSVGLGGLGGTNSVMVGMRRLNDSRLAG